MPLLLQSSVVFLSSLICYHSVYCLNIQPECDHKYQFKSQWTPQEKLLINCFISPNWPPNETLNISIHKKEFFLRKDPLENNNNLLVPKPSVGWTSILVQRSDNGTLKFEDVWGNSLLRNPDELKTQKPLLEVTVSGNMFGFINCPKIRNFYVVVGGEGKTVPVTFFNGLTKLAFSADKVDSFKLKILSHNKDVQVFVCKKSQTSEFLVVRPNGDSRLCQMFKEKDYFLHLNISSFGQRAFTTRGNESVGKIVILSTEGNFYVQANASYEEADFLIREEEEEPKYIPTTIIVGPKKASNETSSLLRKKIYKLLPIIIVSSCLCLVLVGLGLGAYCYYKIYQKKLNIKTSKKQAGRSTNLIVSATEASVLNTMTPPTFRFRNNQSLGLKSSSSFALRPPPIPEEQEEDNTTVVYDEYCEPTLA